MVTTVPEAGLAGLTNGQLLNRIEGVFDGFVTVDANLPAQQNLVGRSFVVVVVRPRSNTIRALLPLCPAIEEALLRARPGIPEWVS
jgi:hypothetical protein